MESGVFPRGLGINGLYLEGQGDFVSRLVTFITHIVPLIISIINLLTKSPDPPSRVRDFRWGVWESFLDG